MRQSRLTVCIGAFLTLALGLSGCTGTSASTAEGKEGTAVVVRVIDGDTIVAKVGSSEETVRLLNLDTPETKDPKEPVECFGPQTTDQLESLLAPGDEVTLKYDQERHDKYGRTLAGVFKGEQLVNAEMARQGLGVSMLVEPNRRFYAEVQAAEKEARNAGRGLFGRASESLEAADGASCSLQAIAATAQDEAEDALNETVDDSSSAAAAIVTTAAALGLVRKALRVVEDSGDVSRRLLRQLDGGATAQKLRAAVGKLNAKKEKLGAQKKKFEAAEEKERRRLAAAKKAAGAKARAAKIEAERKAAAKRAEAKRQEALRKQKAAAAKKNSSSGSSSSGGYPGYTGPRCYAPGGKSWRPC